MPGPGWASVRQGTGCGSRLAPLVSGRGVRRGEPGRGFWLGAETGLLVPPATPSLSPQGPGASFPPTSPGAPVSAAGSRAWACGWLPCGLQPRGWGGSIWTRCPRSRVWPAKAEEGAHLVFCKDRKHLVGLGSLRDTKESGGPVGTRHLLYRLRPPGRACDWTLRSRGRTCSRVTGWRVA